MGEERKVCKVLVEKPEGKRPLRNQGLDGRMGIRMELMEVGWCIQLDQDRDQWQTLVNMMLTLRVWRHGVSFSK
jgi:hypothetical protein